MYRIIIAEYGLRVYLSGIIKADEAENWAGDMMEVLENIKPGFRLFADLRGLSPAGRDVQDIISAVQREYIEHGLEKSVIVFDNALAVLQMKKTAKDSGVVKSERYINADKNPEWETQAEAWLTEGAEPSD